MAIRRDSRGRFASTGGGQVRSIKNPGRTVKGGGEKTRGETRQSRNLRNKAGEDFMVGNYKAFKPYDAALGKSVYANRKVKKLEKAGAEKSAIAKARKDADIKEAATRAARKQTFAQVKVNQRRYRGAKGLIQERRYARPR
jgi:hypothetical protein